MQTLTQADELHCVVNRWHHANETVGLVVLQRGIHAGHLRLIEESKARAARTVVIRFLNPLVHARADEMDAYPDDLLRDEALCAAHGVDILFSPKMDAIFPKGFSSYAGEERLSRGLAGPSRPGYYRGLCTALAVFLNLVRPIWLIWGQKDVQQAAIVQKFIADMRWATRCVCVPAVRSQEGVAWTSRLAKMDAGQKKEAVRLLEALQLGRRLIDEGARSPERILAEVTHHLTRSRRIRVLYVALVDKDTLEPVRNLETRSGVLTASVWVDQIRLVDSLEA